MNELEQIRLYLRDNKKKPRFSDEDLQHLYENQESVEGAVALGWLLVAAETGEGSVSESIGNTSESYGQPTEKYKVAMAMHHYWRSLVPSASSGGLWLEMVPDYDEGRGGIIAELVQYRDFIHQYWNWDHSRPLPVF